jgi:hypothetical protein
VNLREDLYFKLTAPSLDTEQFSYQPQIDLTLSVWYGNEKLVTEDSCVVREQGIGDHQWSWSAALVTADQRDVISLTCLSVICQVLVTSASL